MYKYQHIYLPILYGVLGLKFRLQDFTDTFMKCVPCCSKWFPFACAPPPPPTHIHTAACISLSRLCTVSP